MTPSSDDERQPLLSTSSDQSNEALQPKPRDEHVEVPFPITKFILALIGVFLANADTSLVVATYPSIASDFWKLEAGSWLLTMYTFGFCLGLPAYGAMSDAFGRKRPLLTAYCLFGMGCVISGTALKFEQVVLGRMISGLGGAGMTTVISIIITDLAPLSEVAILRSYINIAGVAGRGAGGPIGGLLYDSIGWRWSFLVQVPVVLGCFAVALWQSLPQLDSGRRKRQLDLAGLFAFALTITSFLLLIDSAQKDGGLDSPITLAFFATFLTFATAFMFIEHFWANAPLISRSLLIKQQVWPHLAVQALLFMAQFALVSNIATYFARTDYATNSIAGLHITPAPIANAIGSLVAGKIISRTKRYKLLSIVAASICVASFILIMLRWRGQISVWESLEIFPTSLGVGLLSSSQFIGSSAAVEKGNLATTISMFFLSGQIGMIIGAGGSAALARNGFRDALMRNLGNQPNKDHVIKLVLGNTHAAKSFSKALQAIVLTSYVHAFSSILIFSICGSSLMLPLLAISQERRID